MHPGKRLSANLIFDKAPIVLRFMGRGLFVVVLLLAAAFGAPAVDAQSDSFQSVFDNHSAIILLIRPTDGRIVAANGAAEDFYGYSREDLTSLSIQDINQLTPEEVAAERALAQQEHRNYFIFRHRVADGRIKTVEVYSNPATVNGETVLVSVINDISAKRNLQDELWHYQSRLEEMVDRQTEEIRAGNRTTVTVLVSSIVLLSLVLIVLIIVMRKRRQVELAYRESEQRFRATFEQAGAGMAMVAPDGRLLRANQKFCDFLGYDQEGLTGKTFAEVTHPEDMASDVENMKRLETGEIATFTLEKRYLRKDGESTWGQLTVAAVRDGRGKPLYYLPVVVDINDRKAIEQKVANSEVKFYSVFESAGAAMAITVLEDGTLEEVNKEFVEGFGFTEAELIGRTVLELGIIKPEQRETLKADVIRDGRIDNREFVMRRNDGSPYYCLYSGRVIDVAGRRRLLSVIQDIGPQKEAEATLRRMIEELTHSNTELERFAYVASHDLQEPLRTVISHSQLLERKLADRLSGDSRETLGFIIDGAKRMRNLVRDLLTYSRAGQRDHPFEPVELNTIMTAMRANLNAALEDSGARLTVAEMPVVQGDNLQLLEVFQNVVSNAIKFREPDRPLEIQIAVTDDKPNAYHITISDNGIGFESNYGDRIFKIFERLHTMADYPGTGIGLAICRRIVERHGGRIWAESVPDQGSTFHIVIPKL